MKGRPGWTALSFSIVVAGCASGAGIRVAGARALEGRLVAPCCFNGTLDIHESPLAHELRGEIEARLARGEVAEAIENDFIERYGPGVIAARSDVPLAALGVGGAALFLAAGVALLAAVMRWTRRAAALPIEAPAVASGPAPHSDLELDARLDAELRELE